MKTLLLCPLGFHTKLNLTYSIIGVLCVSRLLWEGQGAITEKLRSLSMHDLTQISQQDDGGNQLYQYSSHSANPAIRRSQSTDAADGAEYLYDQEERTDEEAEPTFSEDEAVSQKGLRRSQSVKIARSRVRKDARYGSLKIKGKKRPALSSVNYGM
ncbi:receptor expression-enhancing protein 3 [Lates japonicus]|uniref:Receptor expression-enhancing protein 3 n=1 Tax=Lates japonicus TaxID=270547 RepID=A0AAD3NDL7_LATJO|nr:receptor expression-enhancing protein 3 [Lates japonicus]